MNDSIQVQNPTIHIKSKIAKRGFRIFPRTPECASAQAVCLPLVIFYPPDVMHAKDIKVSCKRYLHPGTNILYCLIALSDIP
jgi:hypothetical protein